jgi:hypothetical protein
MPRSLKVFAIERVDSSAFGVTISTQGFGVRVYLKQMNEPELLSRVPAVALVIAFGAP